MKSMRKIYALALALTLALTLAACGGGTGGSASSASSGSAPAGSASEAVSEGSSSAAALAGNTGESASAQPAEIVGKPWATSILSGNLPAQQPALKDDLYSHYAYDYLAAHQGQDISALYEHRGEVRTALLQIVRDGSKTGHDIDQLRIFFDQAADLDTVKAAGISELQPYLDRIDAVTSIDEMNALLVAEDFPFSPFIVAGLTTNDTRTTNIVGITPDLLLSESDVDGSLYYQDSDDPQQQAAMDGALKNAALTAVIDLMTAGVEAPTAQDKEVLETQFIDFEKAHAKHLEVQSTFLKADYGAMAETARDSYFTLDELSSLAADFPIAGVLGKLGKANSDTYVVSRAWLEAFGGLWTAENLDTIKLIAKAQVLKETRPYRDPTDMDNVRTALGQPASDADTFAYDACNSLNTFAQVLAKTYADDVLGAGAKERLMKLTQDLVGEYRTLVDSTPWLGEESKANIIEKLDHMALNVLEPQGGYFDYSGLELTPTDQGGTLMSNYLKLKRYRWDRESEMVGAPAVPASSWFTTSPLISNAFYDATTNSINILPGYVTSLIYRDDMDDAELLACAGFTIGHEISHGFDYLGSQVDAYGQPNLVFSDADVDAFVLKTSTLALFYNGIEMEPDWHVDGQNVGAEAVADLTGMQVNLELAKKVDGFDYETYFRSLSNMWAVVMTEPTLQRQAVDMHPIQNLRVNVNAQMLGTIYDVFGVAEGDGMYLTAEERINIWGQNA